MPTDKSKIGKRNKSAFCKARRKKPVTDKNKGDKAMYSEERKKSLSESDKGPYFNQEKQWPKLSSDSSEVRELSSRSKQKLNKSIESLQKRNAAVAEVTSESLSESNSWESVSDFASSDSEDNIFVSYQPPFLF